MITISAFKWVPPFAAGNVRDHRVRWMLEEVGWPYAVRNIDAPTQKSAEYRSRQPFGQVPYLEEDGRPAMFETGAIVIDVALRSGKLIPDDEAGRAAVLTWVIAALNSVEPFLMNVAEVEYFMPDKRQQELRRPDVVKAAKGRLADLEKALGDRPFLVGDSFTIADLMMASVLKIARELKLLDDVLKLAAWQARCLDRPAYRKAVADQCATIDAHAPADMKYGEPANV